MKIKLQLAGYEYSKDKAEFLTNKGFKFKEADKNGVCKLDIYNYEDADEIDMELNSLKQLFKLLELDTSTDKPQELILSKDRILIYDANVE